VPVKARKDVEGLWQKLQDKFEPEAEIVVSLEVPVRNADNPVPQPKRSFSAFPDSLALPGGIVFRCDSMTENVTCSVTGPED